jgi:hypothetical protein
LTRVDTSNWSGEGALTQSLIDWLQRLDSIELVRVENAPATRSEADYNFISNEIFVAFATDARRECVKRFGFLPAKRTVAVKRLTIPDLGQALSAAPEIGAPDYADEGLLQYLRTERIVPPYQTRGYKLVELVRVYEAGAERRPSPKG